MNKTSSQCGHAFLNSCNQYNSNFFRCLTKEMQDTQMLLTPVLGGTLINMQMHVFFKQSFVFRVHNAIRLGSKKFSSKSNF